MSRSLRLVFLVLGAVVLLAALAFAVFTNDTARGLASFVWGRLRGGYTVAERVDQHGMAVEARLRTVFESAGLPYPPQELAYVSFKDTRNLEVYGRMASDRPWQFVKDYPVLGVSGDLGPKLAEGDRQIPEGVYAVESLNPNSRFHLSIRLNYPNEFDLRMAQADGRSKLGGDIMIHGSSVSIGCLAMGDAAVEDLFVLAALVTPGRLRVLISPTDFRGRSARVQLDGPDWVQALYAELRSELAQFHRPG